MRSVSSTLAATAPLALLLALTSCGAPRDEAEDAATDTSSQSGSPESTPAEDCTKDNLETMSAGTLTVATDSPAYSPWFVDDDPTNGKGYESAVAYAIAEQLGYAEDEVEWVTVPFNAVVSPGEKKFDFDVNQVSITEQRKKAVDFSSGYYDVRQTVITNEGSAIDGATSIADLADATLGAQVGTTSYNAIEEQIGTSEQAAAFDTNDQAVQALKNGQIDGIVVDLPTAYFMTAVQLDKGTIVGQLPLPGGEVEQFGAVLDKDSPLTDCVSQAVDALREDGTLDEIAAQWLEQQGAPELS
jgi:polar amino acid transport system substrate-binding protein